MDVTKLTTQRLKKMKAAVYRQRELGMAHYGSSTSLIHLIRKELKKRNDV